ncbi:hypothetical protein WMY93_025353 [Mugilogobius chulae]|uniref:ACB domain-containing protein n=1 Tax=Mugilogobius chulae TaxID=88201 RepID=A0AAW0N388_9GOBI
MASGSPSSLRTQRRAPVPTQLGPTLASLSVEQLGLGLRLGLGKFDCSVAAMGEDRLEGEELEREFESAADRLGLWFRLPAETSCCTCTRAINRQAWKQLGDMDAEQAMQEYISLVNVLDPEGSSKCYFNRKEEEQKREQALEEQQDSFRVKKVCGVKQTRAGGADSPMDVRLDETP